jgi:hypothetical protein
VALALGFSVLAFSNFMPIIHFGLLSAMVMFFALIGDMFVTPILLSSTQLITLWDLLTLSVRREVIEGSPLFRHMHKIWIKKVILLGRLREKKAGETVMREGDHGESMCLLLSGTAEVFLADRQGHKIDLATLKPGDVFGEIALIDPGPRSANVKALEDLSYIELDMKGLRRIQRIYPRISSRLFMNVSDILGKRLSATNYMLSEWRLRT